MSHMSFIDLYESIDAPALKASEIALPKNMDGVFYVSESGELYCYAGAYTPGKGNVCFQCSPYYAVGKKPKQVEKQIKGFFRLENGCILLDKFVDQHYESDELIKEVSDYILRLPTLNNCYFAVEKRIETGGSWYFEEKPEVTRHIFGLTFEELEYFMGIYAETFGLKNDYSQYPRLTRSLKRDNFCDLTKLWIPAGFPYITFAESGFDYSHISLFGFYRYVGMSVATGINSGAYRLLTHQSLAKSIINRILQIDDYFPFAKKALQRDIWIKE